MVSIPVEDSDFFFVLSSCRVDQFTVHNFITRLKIHHLYSLIKKKLISVEYINCTLVFIILFSKQKLKIPRGVWWGDNYEILVGGFAADSEPAVMKRFYLLK